MNKLKKVLSAVVEASSRPAESWRFLRQAVRELHVVLQGATSIVADFEARLDRLEKAATQRPEPKAAKSPRAAAKARPKKTASPAPRKASKKAVRKRSKSR